MNCQINNLTLPASLHNIDRGAFSTNGIYTLNFDPHGALETIGYGAFENNKLTSLTIPSSVRIIEDCAFYGNRISTLVLENGIRRIGPNSFNSNLVTSLVIPDSVQNIDSWAFSHNPLATVELPKHTVAEDAFPSTTKVIRPGQTHEKIKIAYSNNSVYDTVKEKQRSPV